MVDLALAQRAVWIEDVSLAIFGDEPKKDRIRELTKGVMADREQGLDERQELAALRGLAQDLGPEQAAALKKQVDFVEYCRKRGISW